MVPFESFRGDFHNLANLMQQSWSENSQEPLHYSEAFLESAFQQPGSSFDLCPALYESGSLSAFGAGFPRRIECDGQVCNVLLVSFITLAPHLKGKGLGAFLWNAIADRARKGGFEGLVTFCVEGDRMNRTLLKSAERYAVPTLNALTVGYFARPVPKERILKATPADPDILLNCSASLATPARLTRRWTASEAAWQCRVRLGAFGCSLASSSAEGVISAYVMQTGGRKAVSCGLVDDILWADLDPAGQGCLVQYLLDAASVNGVELLLIPDLGYADLTAFMGAGFRRTRRVLQMYLSSWSPNLALKPLSSAYIDVF